MIKICLQWRGQDSSLIKRAVAFMHDHKLIHSPVRVSPLKNTKEDSMANTDTPDRSWLELSKIADQKTINDLKEGSLIANIGFRIGVNYSHGFSAKNSFY